MNRIETSILPPSEKKAAFVRIRSAGRDFKVSGCTEAFLGHRIPGDGSRAPDGIFADWRWDGTRLIVQTDRYGIYPLFYRVTDAEICVSPSLPRVLEETCDSELNLEALSIFLRVGFFLAEDTAFKNIHLLPPSGRLEWDGRLRISGDISIQRPITLSDEEAISNYRELFGKAIARRTVDARTCIPLSGGRDSRHILFELVAQGHPPSFCATMRYPPPYSSEDEIAKQVCDAVKVEHRSIETHYLDPEWEEKKNLETNFCALEHRWILELADNLRGSQAFLYDGVAGDVLSAGHFLDEARLRYFRRQDLSGLANHLLGSDVIQKLVPRWAKERFSRDLAVKRLVQELERHVTAPNPVGSFFFWNRTRRVAAIGAYAVLESVGKVLVPFLDHDLWDFLSSLPAEMLLDHSFHTRTIEQTYPELAHLPFVKKANIPVNSAVIRKRAVRLAAFLSHHPDGLLAKSAYLPRILRSVITPHYYVHMGLENVMIYLAQLGQLATNARLSRGNVMQAGA